MSDNPTMPVGGNILFMGAESVEIGEVKGHHVGMKLNGLGGSLGLADGLGLVVLLLPAEARKIAQSLQNMALSIEAGSPQPDRAN